MARRAGKASVMRSTSSLMLYDILPRLGIRRYRRSLLEAGPHRASRSQLCKCVLHRHDQFCRERR